MIGKRIGRYELIEFLGSGSKGIYAGGQPFDPDSGRLVQDLSEVSGYPYPPIDAGCLYTGQLID